MADIHQKLAEEKILKAIRARRRFKAAFRHVLHNKYWLDDEADDVDPNNLRTTYRLVKKRKPKEGFSFKEKVLLRQKIEDRTEEEISYLHKFIGGLKCFRQYPEEVQLALVGVTFFEYFGPGRTLIKEGHEGHGLYILLSGEVIVVKKIWDEITNEYVDETVATLTDGRMFGEISLLHNIPRTATVITTAPCELLVLDKEDFDRVLKASLLEKWVEIQDAMSKFVYFNHWDNVKIRECCLISKIKTYSENQVVYGDRIQKKGAVKMTYFLAEGSCKVVEHMFVQKSVKNGITSYKMHSPPVVNLEKRAPSIILDVVSYEELVQPNKEGVGEGEGEREEKGEGEGAEEREGEGEGEGVEEGEGEGERRGGGDGEGEGEGEGEEEGVGEGEGEGEQRLIINPELRASLVNKLSLIDKERSLLTTKSLSKRSASVYTDIMSASQHRHKSMVVQDFIRKVTQKLLHPVSSEEEEQERSSERVLSGVDKEVKPKFGLLSMKSLIEGERRRTEGLIRASMRDVPQKYKLVFVQVCTLSERASFSEGDLLNNRRIIATTPVKCLVIPTYWLVQQNTGNVWTRLDRYLHQRIPTTQQVFEQYKKNKKWQDYRKKLRDEILSKKKICNNTTIHDVPYSIRIMNNY